MNKLLTVFSFEFKQYFKKKSSIVMFVIYFLLAIGLTFIPSLFGEKGILKDLFAGEDNSNFQRSAYIIKDVNINLDKNYLKEAKEYTDRTKIEQDIKDDKLDEAIIITRDKYEYLTKSSLYVDITPFNLVFDNILKQDYYEKQGFNYLQIRDLDNSSPKAQLVTIGGSGNQKDVAIKTSLVYFLSFILYSLVFMYGTVTANNVAREKTNRAMELLIVTVKPAYIIIGKVLAYSLIAMLQVFLLIGTIFIGIKINSNRYSDFISDIVKNIDYNLILIWFLFTITALVMFMFLFSSFASLVSRIEELNTVLTLPIMIFMGAFFANIYTLGSAGQSKLIDFLSYFPLTSYFSMVSKYAVTDISLLEVIISYIILLTWTVFVAVISIIVYRRATLRYGQKLNFFKLLKK